MIKRWVLRRKIKQAVKLLAKIDMMMIALKMPRRQKKQMWRDFVKSEKQRMNVIEILDGAKP